jgi:Leucine-rich repeat (LRR) protein
MAGMPALKQVQAVADKLKDFNPAFDGNVAKKIENEKVIGLAFVSDNVTDVSPVRAIEGLQILSCPGSAPGAGRLADLWPLKRMRLTHLNVVNTAVTDLSPLKEMKIADLDISGTPVTDLSSLKGTGLASLRMSHTQVTELAPLTDLPLAFLDYSGVRLANLSVLNELPLKGVRCDFKPLRDATVLRSMATLETIDGKPAALFWKEADARQAAIDRWMQEVAEMPADRQVKAVAQKLRDLNPEFDGTVKHDIVEGRVVRLDFLSDHVTDLTPLRALSGLTVLECPGTDPTPGKLADLWPLKGLPLRTLNCDVSQIADLSPLEGMSLQGLTIYRTKVSDLSPLAGMPLVSLHCGLSNVSDLSPLRGMPLANLNAFGTQVTDLSPLRGLKLNQIDLAGSPVRDLWPLRGMPLAGLGCDDTPITTLAPLRGLPLTHLRCNRVHVSDFSPLLESPLQQLDCDFSPLRDASVLRQIKTLKIVNQKPAQELWTELGVRGR